MREHRHRAKKRTTYPYSGPVVPYRWQNPAAHGNIMEVQECCCGAYRCININGSARERGPWIMPKEPRQQ